MKRAENTQKDWRTNQRSEDYCSKTCGAKCCYIYVDGESVRCPQLGEDNKCAVYQERYGKRGDEPVVIVGSWVRKGIKDIEGNSPSMPFYCGRIQDLLSKGLLSEEVRKGCWYNDEI